MATDPASDHLRWLPHIIFASGWLAAAMLVGTFSFFGGAFMLVVCPLATMIVARRLAGRSILEFNPSVVIVLGFSVFFGAGLLNVQLDAGLRFATVGDVDQPFVLSTLLVLVIIVLALTLDQGLNHGPLRSGVLEVSSSSLARLELLAQVLWCAALVGTALTVWAAGGLASAVSILTVHNKALTNELGSANGQALWHLLALPACIAIGSLTFVRELSLRRRRLYSAQLAVLLVTGLLIYGSRLLLTLSVVGLLGSYHYLRGRGPRTWVVLGVGAIIALVSIPLLAFRTAGSVAHYPTSVAQIVGYNIFDVSLAAVQVQDALGPQLRNVDRFTLAAGSAIPEFGVDAKVLAPYRADTLVAQFIDGGNIRRGLVTGFPPSLPAALLVAYGVFGGALIALLLSRCISSLHRWFYRRRDRNSAILVAAYGLSISTIFNLFKDGDLAIFVGSTLKTVLILAVTYGACAAFVARSDARVSAR